MSEGSAPGEPVRPGSSGGIEDREEDGDAGPSSPARSPAEDRLIRLMEEFRRRQRERPDLVVRPWWVSDGAGAAGRLAERRGALGFVVEYCPRGGDSAELAVRPDRVRVEGPAGLREASLELATGWLLAGEDVECAELLANHLLSMADGLLGEPA